MPELSVLTLKLEVDEQEISKIQNLNIDIDSSELQTFNQSLESTGNNINDIEERLKDLGLIGAGALGASTINLPAASTILTQISKLALIITAFQSGKFLGNETKKLLDDIEKNRSVVTDDKLPPIVEAIRNPNSSPPINFQELQERIKEENRFDPQKILQQIEERQKVREALQKFMDEFIIGDIPPVNLGPTPEELERNEQLRDILRMRIHDNEKLIDAQNAADQAARKLNETGVEGNKINEESIKLNKDNTQGLNNVGKSHSTAAAETKKFNEAASETHEIAEFTIDDILSLEGKLAMVGDRFIAVSDDQSTFQKEAGNTAEALDKQAKEVDNVDASIQGLVSQNAEVINSEEQVKKSVEDVGNAMGDTGVKTEELTEETKNASEVLTGLGVFAADVAANINDAFSDLIFDGLKGNLDNLSELWDATLDSMLRTFSDFAATIISNPIRIILDSVLRGEGAGGKGLLGSIGSVFDIGQGFKTIGKGLGKIPGLSSITGLFAEGGALAGVSSFLSSALPVVGAIASVAAFAIPIISGLFKKTPRLDLDFDQFRDEFGKSIGVAAEVQDFLDEESAVLSGNFAKKYQEKANVEFLKENYKLAA